MQQMTEQNTPDTAAEPEAPTPPPSPPRRSRLWLRVLGILLLLLLVLSGSLYWLTATTSGFAMLWTLAERASAGQLKVGRSSGTLWHGFSLQNVQWHSPTQQLTLSQLKLDWQPKALWQRQLVIHSLALGNVRYRGQSQSSQPPVAPDNLRLPLAIRVERLTLGALDMADGPPLLAGLQARYHYQQQQHALALDKVQTPWGRLHAAVALGANAPFTLGGQLDYRGTLEGVDTHGMLQLQKNLLQPRVSGTVTALGLSADLDATLKPFAAQALQRLNQLDVRLGGINPRVLNKAWPQAELGLALQLTPKSEQLIEGGVALINYQSGPLDTGKLPLSLLTGPFHIRGDTLQLDQLVAQLGGGSATLAGSASPVAMQLALTLKDIDTRQLSTKLPSHALAGSLRASGKPAALQLAVALNSGALTLKGDFSQPVPQQWQMQNVVLGTGAGKLLLDGKIGLGKVPALTLNGQLQGVNPALVDPRWPQGNIRGDLKVDAKLTTQPAGDVRLKLLPGTLSGAPLGGEIQARWQQNRLQMLNGQLTLGGNRLQVNGAYGQAGDTLKLKLDAPQLALLGPAFAGRISGDLLLGGVPVRPQLNADLNASNLRLPGNISMDSLSLSGESGTVATSPLRLQIAARALALSGQRLNQLQLNLDGSRASHRLLLTADGQIQQKPQRVQLDMAGGLDEREFAWRGSVQQLEMTGWLPLKLQQAASLQASASQFTLAPSRWQALGAQWQLAETRWQQNAGWQSEGRVDALALSALTPWLTLPVRQSLVFDAAWQLAAVQGWPQGKVTLQRRQGDVWLPAPAGEQALGLSQASLAVGLGAQGPLQLALDTRFGQLQANGDIHWGNGSDPLAAPLTGTLNLNIPSLAQAQPWLKAGMTLSGGLASRLQLGGTLGKPTLDGALTGRSLNFTERRNGIRLVSGELQARLAGQDLLIDSLRFGAAGELSANGRIALLGTIPEAELVLVFTRFAALDRPGRRVLLSGNSRIDIRDRAVTLSGLLTVDEGRIDLPKLGGPRLSDDVVVLGREVTDDQGNSWPLAMDLRVQLGDKLRFGGNGLDAWLGGDIRLLAAAGGPLQARGQLRLDQGRFKAYGQDLDITRGVISFSGPLDNPVLDVRAKRRYSPVGAGVEVSGSVLNPTVKLVADEAMSEKDKLSWLVLGRAAGVGESGGATAGAAAGGMLAGLINDQIGLFDDIGVMSREDKSSASGTISPGEQVVTLGKQLTRELYVGYEYGLRSAEQALKVSYQLSRTLSLIGRAGHEASSELRYTLRFD